MKISLTNTHGLGLQAKKGQPRSLPVSQPRGESEGKLWEAFIREGIPSG